MDNIVIKQIAPCAERIKQMCREYLTKVTNLAIATGNIPPNRKPNRVDLKKALLDATKGKSITSFIKFMDSQDKRHLLTMIHMECPVTCPSKNIMLPPVESMPRNVMRSAKKLRNFFGVPEAQICRGCVKRVRCRKYQQIERDLPDLSDIAAILIGVYSICKLNLKESPLVVAQSSLKELDSIIAITGTLMSYIQSILTKPDPVTLDENERNRLLQKHRKLVELKQLEILKEKAFNLPKHFNVTPAEHTYMTNFQREMYKKLSKPVSKRNEDDDIWVVDRGDTTLSDDPNETFKGLSKLNDAHLYSLPKSVTADPVDPKHVEQLHPGIVQFRMNYDTPMGGDLDIVRYDIKQDSFIQGVKVNAKGKIVIDLEKHVSSPNPHIDIAKGLEAYRPISENVASRYQSLVKSLETDSMRLPFLKRVNYDFGSQSSGGIDQPNDKNSTNEASHLEDLITALHS